MKFKFNIPALLMASLVFLASNGLVISEHICSSSKVHSFGLFSKAECGMEKQIPPCCAKDPKSHSNGCCQHKQIFSKLSYDGFTATVFQAKPYKFVQFHFLLNDFTAFITTYPVNHYSGLPPPDNLHIKHLLCPTASGLQIYRC